MCFLNFSRFFCKKTETNFDNRENSCDRKEDKCHGGSKLYHFKDDDCNIDRFECGNKRPDWGCGGNKKPSCGSADRPNWGCDNDDRKPSCNGESRPNWGCDNDDRKPSCNGESRPNWGCGNNDNKQEHPPVLDNPGLPEQPSTPNEPEIPSVPSLPNDSQDSTIPPTPSISDKPNEDVSNPSIDQDEVADDDYCAELPDIEKTDSNI